MPKSKIDPEKYKDLISTNKNLVADYRPLNFDSLLARKALRVTHQGISDEEYNPDPKAGFSLVSAYNDATGKGEGTNKWKDNPDMYPVVRKMLQNSPENIGAHKYLQIVESAKDLGLSDDEIYMPASSTEYSKGGSVKKAKKQMKQLFEEGGMLQEGGTVDEKSGNEVPVGSLKKEVRDDIPAQLSEGEFVFPADVVRFIGLQKLMELRQAAKEGLGKMEAMGQMGNSDEATEEDTGEFETELDDIFKEIETENQTKSIPLKKSKGEQLKFQEGGDVTQTTEKKTVPPNPFSVPFSVERYSKEGEKDIFMPTFGGQSQAAIPEGFQKSTKVQSFGGVFRKADEAQKTVTESLGLPTSAVSKQATTDLTKQTTTDLTKTDQPIPKTYEGLDTEPTKLGEGVVIKDDKNEEFQGDVIGKLYTQIASNFDASKSSGGAFNVKVDPNTKMGFSATEAQKILGKQPTAPQMVILDMARSLAKQGITDISDLSKYKPVEVEEQVSDGGEGGQAITSKVTKYIDPTTNKEFNLSGFGSTYAGEGGTMYQVTLDAQGKPKFSTYGQSTSDAKYIAPALMLATLPFGGIGGIIGSATGATAAVSSSLISAGLSQTAANIVTGAVMNSAVSGITAAITGADVGKAMTSGAISGGLGASAMELSSAILGADTVNSLAKATSLTPKQVASVFSSSVASGINTAISGGDISDMFSAFGQSLVATGVSEIAATNAMNQLKDTVTPENLKRVGTATKALSNVAINASMKGLDVNKAIQYYAPSIMSKVLTGP